MKMRILIIIYFKKIKLEKITEISSNINGKLLVFNDNNISVYSNNNVNYEKENEIEIEKNKKIKYIYDIENYFILNIKEKEEIVFYDKISLQIIFSIEKINTDEKSKIFEISKNLIGITL